MGCFVTAIDLRAYPTLVIGPELEAPAQKSIEKLALSACERIFPKRMSVEVPSTSQLEESASKYL